MYILCHVFKLRKPDCPRCVIHSDSESLAVMYVVLCIQTQKAWLYFMLCYVFRLRKPGCITHCVMYSDPESLAVLYVLLCIQTQKAWLCYMFCCVFGLRKPGCILWFVVYSDSESLTRDTAWLPGCAMSQTQTAWPETLPDCLVVLCLRPSGTSTTASVVYVATPGLNPRHVTTRLVAFMVKASSHAPTHLDR